MDRPLSSVLRPSVLAAAIVAGIVLVAYCNSLSGALVLDDFATVTENESIRHLWPVGPLLSPPDTAGVGGRPLANLTFALSYALSGLDVRGYHAFSIAIHALAGLALYGVLRRTFVQAALRARFATHASTVALAVAALWVSHPLQTAVVDYVSQRTEALMALFYLLTLYCFVRGVDATQPGRGRWHALAVAACAFGMASKEVMVTAPMMVLLYDRTFVAGTWRDALRQRWRVHLALAATWLLLAGLMATSRVADRGVGFDQGVSWGRYALTECAAITRYLGLALWPHPLVFDYGWVHPNGGDALPHALALCAIVATTLYALGRRPVVGFGLAWFLLLLAPTSSVVPVVQQPIAESRMYLPLAGLLTLAVAGAFAQFGRRASIAVAALTFAFCGLTLQRNPAYRTPARLWSDTVAQRKDNARAHCNLGAALFEAGLTPQAIAEFATALQLEPRYPEAHNNLAASLIRTGRALEAIPHLEAALHGQPGFADAHYNLGEAQMQLGRRADAIASFAAAIRLQPHHARAHSNLGVALLDEGRVAEALSQEETALRIDPTLTAAHYNVANALMTAGRLPEAIDHYRTALRLDPNLAKAEHNLAVALLRSGNSPGAIEHFEAALRIQPDYPEARRNLEAVRAQIR